MAVDAQAADQHLVEGHTAVVHEVLAALDRGDWAIVAAHPGLEETRRHLPAFRAAFPDMHHSIETAFADGEMVGCVMSVAGTHRGPFLGMAPTGRPMRIMLVWIDRIVDGRIVQHWALPDFLSLFQQLGALPTAATMTERRPDPDTVSGEG